MCIPPNALIQNHDWYSILIFQCKLEVYLSVFLILNLITRDGHWTGLPIPGISDPWDDFGTARILETAWDCIFYCLITYFSLKTMPIFVWNYLWDSKSYGIQLPRNPNRSFGILKFHGTRVPTSPKAWDFCPGSVWAIFVPVQSVPGESVPTPVLMINRK